MSSTGECPNDENTRYLTMSFMGRAHCGELGQRPAFSVQLPICRRAPFLGLAADYPHSFVRPKSVDEPAALCGTALKLMGFADSKTAAHYALLRREDEGGCFAGRRGASKTSR